MSITFMRMPAVQRATGMSRAAIYAAVAKGLFPAPVKIGARASAWRSDEIEAWINAKIRESRGEQRQTAEGAGR